MSTPYGSPPIEIGTYDLADWHEFMAYLYLPIWMAGMEDIVVPRRLRFATPLIYESFMDAHHLGSKFRYVYVTAKRGFATPGNALNRPGWHTDGFGTDDLNYVWWSSYPSRFAVHPFDGITVDHAQSMAAFDEQADSNYPVEDRRLYRLDPFVVHTTPEIPAPGGMRSFLKVSFSKHRYNLLGNSHNHGIAYDWPMYPRADARNDPAQYGRDFFECAPSPTPNPNHHRRHPNG